MAHREFIDSIGRRWDVWSVVPEFAERRTGQSVEQQVAERRRRDEFRVQLGPEWAKGWLAFSTAGERKRLVPYPPNWIDMSGEQLEALCNLAVPLPQKRRRLIE